MRRRRGSTRRRSSSRRSTAGRPITATTPASATAGSRRSRRTTCISSRSPGRSRPGGRSRSRRRRSWSTASSTSRRPTTSGRSTRARRARSGATPIRANQGFHIGHRGAAVYKDTVYLTTPDAHLVALDAQDGKVKWNVDDRRREEGLLVDQRAARHPQSPDRRRLRRLRQPARHAASRSTPRPASCSGPSTARRRPARPARSAAAPPAGRCG